LNLGQDPEARFGQNLKFKFSRGADIWLGVRLFARRTFTTPKIRTFTTPKFGHFPPPKKNICQEDNCHPQFFSSFFGALFLAFSTYSSWRTSRMGRRRCLTRWSWSTSSRGCVTRWSWSTSSRRCLTSWSWSTSSRGGRAERHSHGGDREVSQGRGEVGRALCFFYVKDSAEVTKEVVVMKDAT